MGFLTAIAQGCGASRAARGAKSKAASFAFAALVACSLAGGQGCAEERDPINQVQTGALPKTSFVGQKLDDAAYD